MAAADAMVLITSATHNATALGFVQSWDVTYTPQDVEVHGEGKTGPQALGVVGEELEVVVNFLNSPFIAPATAPASLVLVGKDTTGGAKTVTCTQMRPRGIAHRATVQGLAVWTQRFLYVGDFTAFPLSVS